MFAHLFSLSLISLSLSLSLISLSLPLATSLLASSLIFLFLCTTSCILPMLNKIIHSLHNPMELQCYWCVFSQANNAH